MIKEVPGRKNRKTGRVYRLPIEITGDGISEEKKRRSEAARIEERKKHPTAYYGPQLTKIKELILKYNKFREALLAWYAIILDCANRMGYNEEQARNMLKKDLSLPREIKEWAEKNELTQAEVIELLLKDEFNYIRELIKCDFDVEDESLRVHIAHVKRDMQIEEKNGIVEKGIEI